MTLPYSRIIDVTLTQNSSFASTTGFGVPLFLTSTTVAGELDASNLTKVYGTIEEVAADFATTDDFYKAATAAFSQNPSPLQIKAAWYNSTTVVDAATMQAALNAIVDADNDWYFLCVETALRDTVMIDGVIAWTEARRKQAFIDTNDVLLKDDSDDTNVAARHKGLVERTSIFYHDTAAYHLAFAAACVLGRNNYDEPASHYTAKYKEIRGIPAISATSSDVQAITGFSPAIGQSTETGHLANTMVNIGGNIMLVEGSTLKANVFIDEIHAGDWVVARTEEQTLNVLLKNKAVPMTDAGMQLLASGARTVMQIARAAGFISSDVDPETGDYSEAVLFDIPSVFTITESQRKRRIAPAISVSYRYVGAVHYTTIRYNVSF